MKFKLNIHPAALPSAAVFFLFMPSQMIIPCASAVLLHEAGHIFACIFLGAGVSAFDITPFGGIIRQRNTVDYKSDAWIYLSGGGINIAAAAVYFLMRAPVLYAVCCAVYGLFNLLPVATLDGGEALSSILLCRCQPDAVARVLKISSGIMIFVLWFFGVYILVTSWGNPSLFLITIYLFFSVFVSKKNE